MERWQRWSSSCAELVQQIADSTEDQVIKDVLNDVVLEIRRLQNVAIEIDVPITKWSMLVWKNTKELPKENERFLWILMVRCLVVA